MSRGPNRPIPPDVILAMQRAAGNRVVSDLLRRRGGDEDPGSPDPHRSVLDGSEPHRSEALASASGRVRPSQISWISDAPGQVAGILNRTLDHLPGPMLRIGLGPLASVQPAFRMATFASLLAGLAAGLFLAPEAGLTPALYLAAWALVVGLLVSVLLVHRLINYAFQTVALVGFLAAGLLLDGPALTYLDLGAVALAVATGIGRLGCAMAGCCHGGPSAWGLCYGPEHVRTGPPVRLIGVRLFPVQLLEFASCLALAGVAAQAALNGPPGTALTIWLAGYAVVRFLLEALRGDKRPSFMGVYQSQWTSVGVAVGTLGAAATGLLPSHPALLVTGVVLPVAAVVRVLHWRSGGGADTHHQDRPVWDEVARTLQTLASDPGSGRPGTPQVLETARGLRLSLQRHSRRGGSVSSYGISHASGFLGPEAMEAAGRMVLRLRHPGGEGRVLRRNSNFACLIVESGVDPDSVAVSPTSEE